MNYNTSFILTAKVGDEKKTIEKLMLKNTYFDKIRIL